MLKKILFIILCFVPILNAIPAWAGSKKLPFSLIIFIVTFFFLYIGWLVLGLWGAITA